MTDELLNALQLIKETCTNIPDNCEQCPLYSYGQRECGVTNNSPMDWKLEKREVYFEWIY